MYRMMERKKKKKKKLKQRLDLSSLPPSVRALAHAGEREGETSELLLSPAFPPTLPPPLLFYLSFLRPWLVASRRGRPSCHDGRHGCRDICECASVGGGGGLK